MNVRDFIENFEIFLRNFIIFSKFANLYEVRKINRNVEPCWPGQAGLGFSDLPHIVMVPSHLPSIIHPTDEIGPNFDIKIQVFQKKLKNLQSVIHGPLYILRNFRFILIISLSLNSFPGFDLKKLLYHKRLIEMMQKFLRMHKRAYKTYCNFFNFI